jgi:hypothetical protein
LAATAARQLVLHDDCADGLDAHGPCGLRLRAVCVDISVESEQAIEPSLIWREPVVWGPLGQVSNEHAANAPTGREGASHGAEEPAAARARGR